MSAKINKFSYISKLLSFKSKLGGDFLSLPCKLSGKRIVFATHRSRVVGYRPFRMEKLCFRRLSQAEHAGLCSYWIVSVLVVLISTILMSASVGSRGMSFGTKLLRTTINTSLPLAIAVISNS